MPPESVPGEQFAQQSPPLPAPPADPARAGADAVASPGGTDVPGMASWQAPAYSPPPTRSSAVPLGVLVI
ncbi:MAG TPA: hypothetical protein VGR61_11300, partial [Candidatus Dormibacteraeota bacterium]|nr:hypothetical protein [Candidatus Dormibacteraeota bacterium]